MAALSQALYDEFRARIADGSFPPGMALPSTRALAAERGLSRTTVSSVYEQLAADGFIDTRAGAASRVAAGARPERPSGPAGPERRHPGRLSSFGTRVAALRLPAPAPPVAGEIDFVYGPLAGRDFPTLAWQKALRAVEAQRPTRLAYEDARGNLALRRALQAHLGQSRGLSCDIDQLLIVNGSQQAIDLCARLLVDPGDRVVVENPGYRAAHHAFEAQGAELVGVDVDALGLRTDRLDGAADARLAFVTPTHQFPLGSFLPIARRHELLAWAARSGAWILEDDYDSEYRYAVRPEATLASLDAAGCVIHVGTFSKTLSPQLRLGYLVLPKALAPMFAAAKRLADRHAATRPQRALARLIADGSYARHVRRIRRLQQARQSALVAALARHLGTRVDVRGTAAGLHVVAWFPALAAQAEAALARAALRRGVRVYPVGPFFLPGVETAPRPAGLVMGYALLDAVQIDAGVAALTAALEAVEAGQD